MSSAARVSSILLIAWLTLAVHELGHALVYWLAGYPAWISFQRVHPGVEPSVAVERLSLALGPVLTLAIAVAALRWARLRGGLVAPAVAFANASLRIFPAAVALVLGATGAAKGFSDEGNIALMLSTSLPVRLAIPALVLVVSVVLTARAARTFQFADRPTIRTLGLYALCFSVGFIAFWLDSLFGLAG